LPDNVDVATGNWGCGVFNGDIRTKFVIQWLACSMTERKMIYCPYGSKEMLENNWKII
jgi:poly(ADP-ribose) glycohydrolase